MEYLKLCLEKPTRANNCLNLAIKNILLLMIISGYYLIKVYEYFYHENPYAFMFAMPYTAMLALCTTSQPILHSRFANDAS